MYIMYWIIYNSLNLRQMESILQSNTNQFNVAVRLSAGDIW